LGDSGGGNAALPVDAAAVQRLGQNPRKCRLAHATGTGEQVGMVDAARLQGIAQGLDHVVLTNHVLEATRAPLAGKNLVGHG
jgi:hypothetical protein